MYKVFDGSIRSGLMINSSLFEECAHLETSSSKTINVSKEKYSVNASNLTLLERSSGYLIL